MICRLVTAEGETGCCHVIRENKNTMFCQCAILQIYVSGVSVTELKSKKNLMSEPHVERNIISVQIKQNVSLTMG